MKGNDRKQTSVVCLPMEMTYLSWVAVSFIFWGRVFSQPKLIDSLTVGELEILGGARSLALLIGSLGPPSQ